jgi:tetratricopeptide (TPR) repeat protein
MMHSPSPLRILILLIGVALPFGLQATAVDSLKTLASTAQDDTTRAKHLHNIGTAYFSSNLDSAMVYWEQALKLGEQLAENDNPAIQKAGKLQVMRSSSNTAVGYQYRGLYPLALRQYQRCLRIAEELDDHAGTMKALNNIGLIKMSQEKPQEALDYFNRSHAIAEELQDSNVLSTTINNVGTALKRLKHYAEALAKFRESLALAELLGNDDQVVDDLINIGAIQIIEKKPDSALATFERSLALATEMEYSLGKPQILNGMSDAYLKLGQMEKALSYAQASIDSARILDLTEDIVGGLEQLANVYKAMGKYELAYVTLKEFIKLNDSLFSTDKALEFGQMEKSFDHEREVYQAELMAHQDAAELRAKNFAQYLISFGVVAVIALLLVVGMRLAKQHRLRYFVVFGALLVFFEFALVLLDNFVDGFTGGMPIPKLLANVLLAALIAPLNVFLEKRLVDGRNAA